MSDIRVYYSFRSPYSRLGLHLIDRAGIKPALIPFTGPPEGNRFDDPVRKRGESRVLNCFFDALPNILRVFDGRFSQIMFFNLTCAAR